MILVYAMMLVIVVIIGSVDFSKYSLDDNTRSLLYCDDSYEPQATEAPQAAEAPQATQEFSNVNESKSEKDAVDLLQRIYGDHK